MTYLEQYARDGYAIVREVFTEQDVANLAREFDCMKSDGLKHPRSFRHQNILYLIEEDTALGRNLRFMHWPSYVGPILNRYRTDPRLLAIIEPLIGRDVKQIINELIWKTPGASKTGYSYHQDARFRRPASAYRNLDSAYVQTAIAVDPHRPENGCLRMARAIHRLGDLSLGSERSVYQGTTEVSELQALGIAPEDVVDIILEPGDVALWGPYTIHGSAPNTSTWDRRAYLNGYVRACDCDLGEWAFRDGAACELGEPVLVQYMDLYQRPDPHYIDGPPNPFLRGDVERPDNG